MIRIKRISRGAAALALAAAIWVPCLHFFFAKEVGEFRCAQGLSPKARQLAAQQLRLWTEPDLRRGEADRMRASNPEWDLLGRSFLAWSLAEMALRDAAAKKEYLRTMDRIIEDTLQLEKDQGMYFFLMPSARNRSYVVQPPRNHFLDGEMALMLAARRTVEENAQYQPLLRERVELMATRMKRSPALSAESYPDVCWTFDNVIALCAMRLADRLDGSDHSWLARQWLDAARQKLVDRRTGLLITSYTTAGERLKGPEGTSIWMVAHCLRMLDESFARDQYRLARKEFGRTLAGFAWSRQRPTSGQRFIPDLEINAGASGLAFIGASAFGDVAYLSALAATLDFAAFPVAKEGRLKYCASNQVGDAALLYATVLGPLWELAEHRSHLTNARSGAADLWPRHLRSFVR